MPFRSALEGVPDARSPCAPSSTGGCSPTVHSVFTQREAEAARTARYASAQARALSRTRLMNPARSVTLIAPRASSRLKVWEHFRAES